MAGRKINMISDTIPCASSRLVPELSSDESDALPPNNPEKPTAQAVLAYPSHPGLIPSTFPPRAPIYLSTYSNELSHNSSYRGSKIRVREVIMSVSVDPDDEMQCPERHTSILITSSITKVSIAWDRKMNGFVLILLC